ncbi:SWIM zinc finger family protein [Halomicrobium mukohataei]|uniref:SWIM zinc finger family protein n=1 Tax=Halomicrobium mukohataei TaxID=57705 RepID=UPI00321693E3
MSQASPGWQPSDDLPDEIGGPSTFTMPEQLTGSMPWERAQTEVDQGGPINDAERMVRLSGGEGSHRVTWALQGQTLLADCDCRGHRFNDGWCAHVASLWWQWVRGGIVVTHLDTGRDYPEPPAWLRFDPQSRPLDELTPAELDAFLHCDVADAGVRSFARRTDRSPGTVGNLLRSAREKLGGAL